VIDPDMVCHRSLILDPLRELGVDPMTDVLLSHHHLAQGQGSGKSRFVLICPMAPRRGPAPRDHVGPGREPGTSDRHVRTFGADRDFAGALSEAQIA
jgi:hypothetical protein